MGGRKAADNFTPGADAASAVRAGLRPGATAAIRGTVMPAERIGG